MMGKSLAPDINDSWAGDASRPRAATEGHEIALITDRNVCARDCNPQDHLLFFNVPSQFAKPQLQSISNPSRNGATLLWQIFTFARFDSGPNEHRALVRENISFDVK